MVVGYTVTEEEGEGDEDADRPFVVNLTGFTLEGEEIGEIWVVG